MAWLVGGIATSAFVLGSAAAAVATGGTSLIAEGIAATTAAAAGGAATAASAATLTVTGVAAADAAITSAAVFGVGAAAGAGSTGIRKMMGQTCHIDELKRIGNNITTHSDILSTLGLINTVLGAPSGALVKKGNKKK